MKKNTTKERLSPEMRRDVVVVAKVTGSQRDRIRKMADRCGMTVSDYILSRCFNYEPKARMSEDEVKALQSLDGCRADLVNYTSALRGMDSVRRKEMFNSYSFMLGWIKELGKLAGRIEDILKKTKAYNKLPS
jgi:hypothetical protein